MLKGDREGERDGRTKGVRENVYKDALHVKTQGIEMV